MRTIFLKTAYDRLKLRGGDPTSVLSQLNEQLIAEFPEGELHSEACCLDLTQVSSGLEVSYTNAGNTPLFVFSTHEPMREHYTAGPLLGVADLDWPKPERFQVAEGELLLLCSDGLLEQMNGKRERFETPLADFRLEAGEGAQAALGRILASFNDFRGAHPVGDDITVIALRVSASFDPHDSLRQPA